MFAEQPDPLPPDESEFSEEEETGQADEANELESAIEDLKRRCAAAEIEYSEFVRNDGRPGVQIELGAGRRERSIVVANLDRAREILAIDFEPYRLLERYEAIVSYRDGRVEARLDTLGRVPALVLLPRVFRLAPGDEIGEDDAIVLEAPAPNEGVRLRLGLGSPELWP